MITADFGKRIRELRRQTGLSQEKFALEIDMDRSYYASVEAGRRNISLRNIEKIADGLEVSLDELFRGMREPDGGEGSSKRRQKHGTDTKE